MPTYRHQFINPSGEPFLFDLNKNIPTDFENRLVLWICLCRSRSFHSFKLQQKWLFGFWYRGEGYDFCPSSAYFWLIWCVDLFQAHTYTKNKTPAKSKSWKSHQLLVHCLLAASSVAYVAATYKHKPPIRAQLCLQQRQCHCNANAPANI